MSKIQIRRDTGSNFASANPVLSPGEPSFETDTKIFKLGDGVTAYNSLPQAQSGTYAPIGGSVFLAPGVDLTTALPAATGEVVLAPGTYNFASPIDLTTKGSLRIRGATTAGDATALVVLNYTGTGTGSAIKLGSSRGVSFSGIKFTHSSSSFTGTLVDGQKVSGGSDTAYLSFSDCLFRGAPASSAAALVRLDGSHDTVFVRCSFWYAQVGLIGKLTQGISSTGGYAINVTLLDCAFPGGITTACIKNADQAWDINATFEPLVGGAAGAYKHDTGVTAQGVTFRSCWLGDDVNGQVGTWVTYGGTALNIVGGFWSANGSTTLVKFDTNSCVGFTVTGAELQGQFGTCTGFDWGSTTGAGNVVVLGIHWSGAWGSPFNNVPAGAVYSTPSTIGPNIDSAALSGSLSATSLTLSNSLSAGSAGLGVASAVNLLTADSASFETSTGSYTVNANCTFAQSTTQALAGTHSLKVTTTAALSDTSVATPLTAVGSLSAGGVYTVFANTFAETNARLARVDVYVFQADGVTQVPGSPFGGTNQTNTLGGWQQTAGVTFTAPANSSRCKLLVRWVNAAANDVFYVDCVQVASGTSLTWGPGGGSSTPMHQFTTTTAGFFGTTPVSRPILSYSRSAASETSSGAALRNALATLGLVNDQTTA